MFNTIKILSLMLICGLLVFAPRVSYAWDDNHGRDGGQGRHEHEFHRHYYPQVTLVSGMDTIDTRVLVASGDNGSVDDVDQSAPEVVLENASAPIAPTDDGGIFIINVPNNRGGYTPIRIQKWGTGYVGPQGEFYYPFPAISQLKAMYNL